MGGGVLEVCAVRRLERVGEMGRIAMPEPLLECGDSSPLFRKRLELPSGAGFLGGKRR
jgi:hypothetical protein